MMFPYLQSKFDREELKAAKLYMYNSIRVCHDLMIHWGAVVLAPRWKDTAAEINKDNDRTQNWVV